jgi:hypothetical protein
MPESESSCPSHHHSDSSGWDHQPIILCADDGAINRKLLQKTLERLGQGRFRIILVENGEEAVRAALEHQPDLIFMDMFVFCFFRHFIDDDMHSKLIFRFLCLFCSCFRHMPIKTGIEGMQETFKFFLSSFPSSFVCLLECLASASLEIRALPGLEDVPIVAISGDVYAQHEEVNYSQVPSC